MGGDGKHQGLPGGSGGGGGQAEHPHVLEAVDDAGQAVGDVGELGEEVGNMLVHELGDQGSVHHGVEALLLDSIRWVTEKNLSWANGDVNVLEQLLEAPGEHADRVYLAEEVRGGVISLQCSRHHLKLYVGESVIVKLPEMFGGNSTDRTEDGKGAVGYP
ncbi:hypothetical protein EMCRGX_G017170 [Ephydatia muelleri]